MTRWLAFPLQALFLLVMWLLLNQPVTLADLVVGAGIGLAGSAILSVLQPPRSRFRRPLAFLRLLRRVLPDIARSNMAVAWIIATGRKRDTTSGFLSIALELRAPYGLAILAIILTSTPGTLWVHFNSTRGVLTIHVLDLVDEQAWIDLVKGRYEKLLMDMFE